jgi:hypothetical protein
LERFIVDDVVIAEKCEGREGAIGSEVQEKNQQAHHVTRCKMVL